MIFIHLTKTMNYMSEYKYLTYMLSKLDVLFQIISYF